MKKAISLLLILSMLSMMFVACNISGSVTITPTETDPTEAPTGEPTQKPGERPTARPTEAPGNFEDDSDNEPDNDIDNDAGNNSGNEPENDPEEDTEVNNWNDDGCLKILTIGNSFSEDTMQYMYKIAKSAGVENVKLGNLVIGGCTLSKHATNARGDKASYTYHTNYNDSWEKNENYKMSTALASESWDFVSLQQASGSSGIADTYSDLEYMIEYVSDLVPKATLVWNMTWAYQQDSTHGEFSKYGSQQMQMYESIVSAVKQRVKTNADIDIIVPNGTAIQNARTSFLGDTLTRDGFHLSLDIGRFIAGLTFFSTVTGISPDRVDYMPAGVDNDIFKVAAESASNAIAEPFDITVSAYPDRPEIDLSRYELLELEWTAFGFWNSSDAVARIVKNGDNCVQYYATRMLTREDLPVGSVIILEKGWKYRPEGWEKVGSRPGNVKTERVEVTEEWWGSYTTRAFNLSKADGSSLVDVSEDEVTAAFIIYVPKV